VLNEVNTGQLYLIEAEMKQLEQRMEIKKDILQETAEQQLRWYWLGGSVGYRDSLDAVRKKGFIPPPVTNLGRSASSLLQDTRLSGLVN
jgi:hypothetical protein